MIVNYLFGDQVRVPAVLLALSCAIIALNYWKTELRQDGIVDERLSRARKSLECGFDDLSISFLLVCLVAVVLVAVGISVTFFFKFDFTDEAQYIYALSHPHDAVMFFIEPIFGRIGILFHNNIIIWRFLALVLILISVWLFADAIFSFVFICCNVKRNKRSRLAVLLAAWSGVPFFYAYGPPTFSYRTAALVAVLFLFGCLSRAVITENRAARHFWAATAALAAVMFAAARPPAALAYPLACLPVIWVSARKWGVARILRVGVLHVIYGLCFAAFFAFAVIGVPTIKMIFARSTDASHSPGAVLSHHLYNILDGLHAAAGFVSVLCVGSAVIAVAWGVLRWRYWTFYLGTFRSVLLQSAALLPLSTAWLYIKYLPAFRAAAAAGCHDPKMFACQGPTPGLTGAQLVPVVWAQLICIAIAGAAGLLQQRYEIKNKLHFGSITSARSLIFIFFVLAALLPSLFTNVGLLYSSILSMPPLTLAVAMAFGFVHLPDIAPPRWLVSSTLALYLIVGTVLAVHNSVIYVHRVRGTIFDQTVRLDAPETLAGLRVNPTAAAAIKWARRTLHRAGYDASKDIILSFYDNAGMVVAAGGRALGSPVINYGYKGIASYNCRLVELDPIDLRRIGRLFVIMNSRPSNKLSACLKKRGVDLAKRRILGKFSVREGAYLTLSVVNVSPR